ncbi:DUF1525 domain-containing protein (plasmid) [Enterobacter bugandensis]|uniref:DUF1525 domain-containing protein n=1 Tax=Enterobacter bugandensis TaxID=881260 RepID=UPI00283AAB05|nr:DUF1525 domain-containing protein [Enterobacter bugandensis]WMU75511.1 DUF1525 domain-containing protein [Enterobacter bugandensis]
MLLDEPERLQLKMFGQLPADPEQATMQTRPNYRAGSSTGARSVQVYICIVTIPSVPRKLF